jgi:hypothetical protein
MVYLAADPDAGPVRVVVAAIALIDIDSAALNAGQRLQLRVHRTEGMAIVAIAAQRLGVSTKWPPLARRS